MGPLASKKTLFICAVNYVKTTDVSQRKTTNRIEQQRLYIKMKNVEVCKDDNQYRANTLHLIFINCVIDAVKWRYETSLNSTLNK